LAVPSSQNTDRATRHPIEEKAGPAPAFLFSIDKLLPTAANAAGFATNR
jgi:hypothetical protein